MCSCHLLSIEFGKASLCVEHRVGDADISAAPAEISAHAFTNALGIVAGLTLLDEADRAHDLARRAKPALKAVMRDEGGLDGVERVASRQAFDRQDVRAIMAEGKSNARIDSSAVDEDRARAALPAIAAFLGPRQVEAFAKEIEERNARVVKCDFPRHAVHGKRN
jgi:hypothetical protein